MADALEGKQREVPLTLPLRTPSFSEIVGRLVFTIRIFWFYFSSFWAAENLAETTENQPNLQNRQVSNKELHLSFYGHLRDRLNVS